MNSIYTPTRQVDSESQSLPAERRWVRSLPWLAWLLPSALYGAHIFFGGGQSHRILDSWAYLQIADGEHAAVPFNTRIVTPFLAALIAAATGLSTSAVFKLLTPAALLASLLILRVVVLRRGGSYQWQAVVLLAFGSSLAVTFGFTPILVDPTLLLFTCLTIAALDAGHLRAALVLATIAALTKEFGLFLSPIWAACAYRQGFRKMAGVGFIVPFAALIIVVFVRQSGAGIGFPGWRPFASHLMFEYQVSVLRVRGPGDYAKLIYMWSWCGLWPLILISVSSLYSRLIKWTRLSADQLGFAVLLAGLPVLLLGDWSRNLIILVPFACLVATAHPLAKDRYVVLLLAIGGFSTALARPFHSEQSPAPFLTLSMTVLSAASSVLLAAMILRFAARSPILHVEASLAESPREVIR